MLSTSHLHPMIVHFPIALVMMGFLFELLSVFFKKQVCWYFASFWLLIFGALAAIAAVVSGDLFTSEMSGAAALVRHTHELMADITLVLLIVNSILRLYMKTSQREYNTLKWISFTLYAITAITVSITGFYGGNLVYSYMLPL
ncbi:MAG TPA: DUF2231 domain-containing protein [Bacteroidales bacterium]|jgi:uncharacterized membrane protein|nr:DUF2231 domain-containing protein [Bacteroidales bacterium]